jgi:hypothetical protein
MAHSVLTQFSRLVRAINPDDPASMISAPHFVWTH